MSRRPTECRGSLVFQEGKKIEGEYYIVAVYDDPSKCTATFAAYELETDKTFTLPYTYSELDELFRFNSELMNPDNKDERYHWVIARLDFMLEDLFHKKLCLAQEPTPEVQTVEARTEKPAALKPFHADKLDGATRTKLLAELDAMDDTNLQLTLVRSENARKGFLQDLHSRRRLTQMKAMQRISMMDEEREERMKRLANTEKFKKDKALKYQQETQAIASTLAQLEVLLKQKEAESIRKLLDDKERTEYDREQRLEMSLQNKRLRELSRKEQRNVVLERCVIQNKKRQTAAQHRFELVMVRSKEIALERQRHIDSTTRIVQLRKEAQEKELSSVAAGKQKKSLEDEKNKQRNEMLDRSRAQKEMEAYNKRNATTVEEIQGLKKEQAWIEKDNEEKKEDIIAMKLADGRMGSKKRAAHKEQAAAMDGLREENIKILLKKREKIRKEKRWFEEREKSEQVVTEVDDEEALRLRFEAEGREKRRLEREAIKEEVEKKTAAVFESSARLRDLQEAKRLQKIKADEYERRALIEQKRLEKESKEREALEEEQQRHAVRQSTFIQGEISRDEKENVRSTNRQEKVMEKVKQVPIGHAIGSKSFLPI
eukprot:GEMP01013147.1.p1 GENE.GEMP01013147.1~~GEMP01013147.1.p1  ORF type:complete len:601 (+),score=177.42 GEMP01013147.1:56-1858(+)